MRRHVVFPDPFGPISPYINPRRHEKDRLLRASTSSPFRNPLKHLYKPEISIEGIVVTVIDNTIRQEQIKG
jgi:hypothetical protein